MTPYIVIALLGYLYAQLMKHEQRSTVYLEIEELKVELLEAYDEENYEERDDIVEELEYLRHVFREIDGWRGLDTIKDRVRAHYSKKVRSNRF